MSAWQATTGTAQSGASGTVIDTSCRNRGSPPHTKNRRRRRCCCCWLLLLLLLLPSSSTHTIGRRDSDSGSTAPSDGNTQVRMCSETKAPHLVAKYGCLDSGVGAAG